MFVPIPTFLPSSLLQAMISEEASASLEEVTDHRTNLAQVEGRDLAPEERIHITTGSPHHKDGEEGDRCTVIHTVKSSNVCYREERSLGLLGGLPGLGGCGGGLGLIGGCTGGLAPIGAIGGLGGLGGFGGCGGFTSGYDR